jgi:hypothetical protein
MIFCADLRNDNVRSIIGFGSRLVRLPFHWVFVFLLRNDGTLQRSIRLCGISLFGGAISGSVVVIWNC